MAIWLKGGFRCAFENDMKSPEKMHRRINNVLKKVFCCGAMPDAAKGSSSDQPLVLSASVSGSQDTVFEAAKGNNLSERDKNSAWLSQKNWHEKQRGFRHSAVFRGTCRFLNVSILAFDFSSRFDEK